MQWRHEGRKRWREMDALEVWELGLNPPRLVNQMQVAAGLAEFT